MYDITIIGGGIVGLSIGWAITRRYPHKRVLLLEKEPRWGHHQTGHNSGEIHAGIYYPPGSLKATFCREGNRAMVEFCREFRIPHQVCGKCVVATAAEELSLLDHLYDRAVSNGVSIAKLSPEELKEREPHCIGVAALHVPSTGIVDYQQVAEKLAELIQKGGGEARLGTEVRAIAVSSDRLRIDSPSSSFETRFLINCAGLQSDRIAKLMGVRTGMRIVPIRGTYYEVREEKRHLVKTLIYPLPNARYPFLGAHFNRHLNGQVRVGPNAVVTLHREGYDPKDFDFRDTLDLCGSSAFWRFAAAHWREGGKELVRSLSKRLFVRRLQRLIPEISSGDLLGLHSGIRAQAVTDEGRLVDDFVIVPGARSMHICNAPSPAATSSFPIANAVVDRLHERGIL
jgi:(S)-2-hydroxyglutarate dehydrogenase